MSKRQVASVNFSRPYVEGTWMAGAYDNCNYDQVHIVGPDENVRLVVEVGDPKYGQAPIMKKLEVAHRLADALTRGEMHQVATVSGIESFGLHPGKLDTHSALKPCPFCGQDAAFHDSGRVETFNRYVQCSNTSCGIRTPEHYQSRTAAAIAWNRRAHS